MGADEKLQTDVCNPAWLATAGRNFLEAPAPHEQEHNALVTIQRLATANAKSGFALFRGTVNAIGVLLVKYLNMCLRALGKIAADD
jgi:hypothetical protein